MMRNLEGAVTSSVLLLITIIVYNFQRNLWKGLYLLQFKNLSNVADINSIAIIVLTVTVCTDVLQLLVTSGSQDCSIWL